MGNFHIAHVGVNLHYRMYDDLIRSVASSLADLGHSASVSYNGIMLGATNILIGSTIFAARHHNLLERLQGNPYIVYQLEQLDELHGLLKQWPEYWALLDNAESIWDYGPSSTRYLRESGLSRVAYLPPGFHPSLTSFAPDPMPDLDVLFCGTPHPRRLRLLEDMDRHGIKTAHASGTYGGERNGVFARAKIILNIHAWDDLNMLETVRLSHLLANRCFVISETGDHNPYEEGVVYAAYDGLVETCLDYLNGPAALRAGIAGKGYDAVRKIDMIAQLRKILG